jgi:glycosyltransferase involved in cell wall biosynthesis
MRVLHATWSAGFGGIERLVLDLAKAQSRLGIHAAVLFGRAEGEFLDAFCQSGLALEAIGLRSGYDISPGKIRRTIAIMADYDIVQIHSYHPVFARCAVKSGRKIIFTDHGNYGQGRPSTFRDPIRRLMQKRFLNRYVDYITFNSRFTRTLAERYFGVERTKRDVVYNGIDLQHYGAQNGTLPREVQERLDGRFVVGTSSRFAGFKRIDRLIRAFGRFQAGRSAALLLVGDGPMRSEYEQLVDEVGIREMTLFAGFQRNVKVFQQAMDVCVFPSEGEPFGLVAVETLSLGKPTIVMSDGGGITEIVGPIQPEDVVPNITGLSDRLVAYYETLGDASDQRIQRIEHARRFDIPLMAEKMANIYRLLVV